MTNQDGRPTPFSQLVRSGEPTLGSFAFLPAPAVVEILALAGYDFVMIDREHSPKDWSMIENMIRAAEARGIPALVRVSENSRSEILSALECGADGIVVPGIVTVEDALAAVDAVRFPGAGSRGACPQTRSASYGAVDYPAFQRQSNADRMLLLLIEEPEAVAGVAAIVEAAGEGVGYMIGRSDLSASLGMPGQPTAPPVEEIAKKFVADVKRVRPDAPVGMGLYGTDEITKWLEVGCDFFWFGADVSIFLSAAQNAIEGLRAASRGGSGQST
jgi:2-keto-3-deoxy-L-rhamnonate aldolase RhmA